MLWEHKLVEDTELVGLDKQREQARAIWPVTNVGRVACRGPGRREIHSVPECGSHILEVWAHQLLLELLACQCEYLLHKKASRHDQHMSPKRSSYIVERTMQIYHNARIVGFSNDVGFYGSSVVGQLHRKHVLNYKEKENITHTLSKQNILVCSGRIHANTKKSVKTHKLQRMGIRTVIRTCSPRFEKQMKGWPFI